MLNELLKDKENLQFFEDKYQFDLEHFLESLDFLQKFICFTEFKVINDSQEDFLLAVTKLPLAKRITTTLLLDLKDFNLSENQKIKIEEMISRYLFYSFFKKVVRRMIIPLFKPIIFLKNVMNGRGPISQLLKFFSNDMDEWVFKLQIELKKLILDPSLNELITTKPGTKRGIMEDELLHGFKLIIGRNSKHYMPQLELIVSNLKRHYPRIFDEVPNEDPNTIRQSIRRSEKSGLPLILQGT